MDLVTLVLPALLAAPVRTREPGQTAVLVNQDETEGTERTEGMDGEAHGDNVASRVDRGSLASPASVESLESQVCPVAMVAADGQA